MNGLLVSWPTWPSSLLEADQEHSISLTLPSSPDTTHSDENQDTLNQPIYTEFDEDFEEELVSPIGTCLALYQFEGSCSAGIPVGGTHNKHSYLWAVHAHNPHLTLLGWRARVAG